MKKIDRIKSRLLHYTWDLAFGAYHDDILRKGLVSKEVKVVHNPYKKKWFADPFIYSEDESFLQLFVEEFDREVKRGRIARIKIDKSNNTIIECNIILDKPSHLSFPAIYRVEDKIFVHPENSASGESVIYRYDEALDKLVEPIVLVKEPLTDAIIKKEEGGYRMYATKMPVPNGNELFVYQSDSLFGPFVYEKSVIYEKAYARMAGSFIHYTGGVIRPAQDSEGGDYGKSVWLYDDNTMIGILRPWGRYDGLHTFNIMGNTFIIDLKKYDFPFLYRFKTLIKKSHEMEK